MEVIVTNWHATEEDDDDMQDTMSLLSDVETFGVQFSSNSPRRLLRNFNHKQPLQIEDFPHDDEMLDVINYEERDHIDTSRWS